MQPDDAQRGLADGKSLGRGREEAEQRAGDELKERAAHAHDGNGRDGREAHGLAHAVELSRAVVVGHDGDHRVVEAEAGHEDEALQLEIRAEDRGRRLGEGDEDVIHAKHHHRADGLHDDRGDADGVNVGNGGAVGADARKAQLDLDIFRVVEHKTERRAEKLARDRGEGRARDLKARKAEKAEDQDGVEHDVAHRARDLRDHRKIRAARALQEALGVDLHENAKRAADADADIVLPVGDDLHVFRLQAEVGRGHRKAEEHEDGGGAEREEKSRACRAVHGRLVLLAQRAREQRVHAHTRAHGKGDAQHLQREGERDGVHRVLTEACDKDAVDDVVERLKEHRHHHRPRHVGKELADGHRAHFVFSDVFLHGFPL